MERKKAVLEKIRSNSYNELTSEDFRGVISDNEIKKIMIDLSEDAIKNYVGIVNPFLFYRYGYRVYLIFASVSGFTDAGKSIEELVKKERWANKLSVYGLFGDRDYLFMLLGNKEDKQFILNWLHDEFNSTVGIITTEYLPYYMRFPMQDLEVDNFKEISPILPMLAKDCRQIDWTIIKDFLDSKSVLGFTILEDYKEEHIKAFVTVRFTNVVQELQIKSFINLIMRDIDCKKSLISVFYGIGREINYSVVFEFDLDGYYELDMITNKFYESSSLIETETQTYIISSSINNIMPYALYDKHSLMHYDLENLSEDLKKTLYYSNTTISSKLNYMLNIFSSYDSDIIKENKYMTNIDHIKKSAINGVINSDSNSYMNSLTDCGKLLEGLLKDIFRKKRKFRYGDVSYDKLAKLMQGDLHLKQKLNLQKLPLGRLATIMEHHWDKYLPESPFFLEEEENDYRKLNDVAVIRNSIGAHWSEMEFSRVESESFWAIDCTMYLFYKLYIRELLPQRRERSQPESSLQDKKKVFISSRGRMKEFGEKIHRSLRQYANGTLFDPYYYSIDMRPGRWMEQLEQGLEKADIFLPILTSDFFDGPVSTAELDMTLRRYNEERNVSIVPIVAEGAISDYNIGFIGAFTMKLISPKLNPGDYSRKIDDLVEFIIKPPV